MFSHAFTEPTFKKGLNKYLTAKAYQAAKDDDLYAGIAAAVKEDNNLDPTYDVADIMDSWTRRPGFPLLSVIRDYENDIIVLSQERYFNNATFEDPLVDKIWWIPFNFITSNESLPNANHTNPDHWLNGKTLNITTNDKVKWSKDNWILFNKQATGYYRIIYDEQNYKLLADSLKKNEASQIDTKQRSQLIDDAFNFARYGRVKFDILLNLMDFLKNDTSYLPWFAGNKVLSFLDNRLAGTDQYDWFRVSKISENKC